MVELLVGVLLLSVISIALFTTLVSATRISKGTRDVVRTSEEGRLGLARMVRDTREGEEVYSVGIDEYRVLVDFDGDGAIAPIGTSNAQGDLEDLSYSFDPTLGRLLLNGEVLMTGVDCIRDETDACTGDVFAYYSTNLRYDWDGDGVTTWQELDAAPSHGVVGVGNGNGTLDAAELPFINEIRYALGVEIEGASVDFNAAAQLRNVR